jgi:hypothetical protein
VMSTTASQYTRANTDWFANCRFGVSVHWTAQTAPRKTGNAASFADDALFQYVRACQRVHTPVSFNVSISREGILASEPIAQLDRLNRALEERDI